MINNFVKIFSKFLKFFFVFILFILLSFNVYSYCSFFSKSKIFVDFSPYGNIEKIILSSINNAKKEILLAAYTFNNKNISKALLKSYNKGINIKILVDGKYNNILKRKKLFYLFKNSNIPIKLNYSYKIMHNKFMVIDNDSVETGSYNYTFNAKYNNAENVIFLKHVPKLSLKYKNEFFRLWNEGVYLKNNY